MHPHGCDICAQSARCACVGQTDAGGRAWAGARRVCVRVRADSGQQAAVGGMVDGERRTLAEEGRTVCRYWAEGRTVCRYQGTGRSARLCLQDLVKSAPRCDF